MLLAQPGSADAVGGAICAAFAEPFNVEGRSIYATTSIGVALWPDHGRVAKEVVSAADIALYAAKSAGRNRVCHFKAGMAEEIERRRELEADLRAVRHGDGLELHYQPLVDLKTKAVVGYEALMRWQHASKGMISPGDFIPLAEQTGLINEMGEWALMRACRDAADWPGEATVAVNVSAVQFREKGRLLSAVRRALKNSKLPGRRLELEVTESVLIGDPEATLDAMRKLRRLGVKVSLDDFGTGYSSLAYVASYPFSKVKIDRSFASKVTSDQSSRAVIEAVCQLGRRLALQVVVEGVETEEQAKALVELGAEQGQGYHFGRPQPLALLRMNKRSAA
jgi:predicted signal transduction protein with EAL and GGDEF domain